MPAGGIEYARINATADGDNTVITGAAGQQIIVLGYSINVNAAGVVTWQDSAGSPVVFASYEFVDGGGASYAGNAEAPAFVVTEGLNLELNTATGVDGLGHVTFMRKTRAR